MPTDFTIPVACVTEFLTTGVAVIPAVLSAEEVLQARQAFHSFLLMEGVDTSRLEETAGALRGLSSTAGSGGVLDVFYESWQLALAENPRVFASLSQLWAASFARDNCDAYRHPYGSFNPCKGYLYLDRLCFRVPDHVSAMHSLTVGKKQRPLQRSLTPHLDCCPHDLYASSNRKWRPVQAFLALTDTLEKDQVRFESKITSIGDNNSIIHFISLFMKGGFEACLGMHLEFDEWVRRRAAGSSSGSSPPCVGQFTPIRPVEDADVMSRMQHVPCRAGDLVCWDFRTPHANRCVIIHIPSLSSSPPLQWLFLYYIQSI